MSPRNDDDDHIGYSVRLKAKRKCEEPDDVRAYYDSLTPEVLGTGWFDQRLETLHDGIDIADGRSFFSDPRTEDTEPSDIPARHPLRAISWMLAQAPVDSTVRMYCYMLTDPYAIDLLIHHGGDKDIQIILHPDNKNLNRLEEFFDEYGRVARRAFHRMEVRIADTSRYAYNYTHDKSIITTKHCTFGSYNLSYPARYQSFESLHIADCEQSQIDRFDRLWDSLERRTILALCPNLAP